MFSFTIACTHLYLCQVWERRSIIRPKATDLSRLATPDEYKYRHLVQPQPKNLDEVKELQSIITALRGEKAFIFVGDLHVSLQCISPGYLHLIWVLLDQGRRRYVQGHSRRQEDTLHDAGLHQDHRSVAHGPMEHRRLLQLRRQCLSRLEAHPNTTHRRQAAEEHPGVRSNMGGNCGKFCASVQTHNR